MNPLGRRAFLAVLALLGVLLKLRRESQAETPDTAFADWVNTLYVGAVAMREAAEAGAGADLTDLDLQGLFTPEVQALRDAVKDRTLPPGEPEGPILHILFGWGALPKRKIEVHAVTAQDATHAGVDLTINGNPRPLVLTGRYNAAAKTWQIDDIDYGDGGLDRTLRGRLERMQSWPKK